MDNKLFEIYVDWEEKVDQDEWYFSNAFEDISNRMSPEEAFNYIPNTIEVILELKNNFLIWETLYFLVDLYNIANTTQVHPYLEKI